MSDNMQPIDEILDDEAEEFDPFEGMSDEELDALCDEDDNLAGFGDVEPGFRSGFVALVGRPNAGKSTLLNACYGKRVAITSPVAQTTRRRMRAVVNPSAGETPGLPSVSDALVARRSWCSPRPMRPTPHRSWSSLRLPTSLWNMTTRL